MSVDLYDVIKASYDDKNKQKKALNKYGFQYDSMLSNRDNQIYFNPKTKQLIHGISGTHRFGDIGTDLYLAAGHLKDTDRYKDSHKILRDAKAKYGVDSATIASHSLGGAIGGYIAGKNDKVYTLDKGATIGQKVRSNEHAYREAGDAVSALDAGSKHMETLKNPSGGLVSNIVKSGLIAAVNPALGVANLISGALGAHSKDVIKDSGIKI